MSYVDAFFDRDSDIIRVVERKDGKRQFHEYQAKYTFYDLGYNLRPTEITGFIGNYQLQFLEDNIKCRQENFLKIEQEKNLLQM